MAKYVANVIHTTDDRNHPVVLIELSNRPGLFCGMDRADWEAWLEAGRSQSLYAQSGGGGVNRKFQVAYSDRENGRTGYATLVARSIIQPPPGKVVRRLSGDPLDLRRCNLRLMDRKERRKIGGW
ncbi:MAG: hypothetical protein ACTHLA_06495 [Asticcacaulis sp.]|uniref:hypothetical protein n=1 Tax=Asticcacaulis sp. TaxID=1872648 RepID=UPI003F7C27E5